MWWLLVMAGQVTWQRTGSWIPTGQTPSRVRNLTPGPAVAATKQFLDSDGPLPGGAEHTPRRHCLPESPYLALHRSSESHGSVAVGLRKSMG